MNPEGIASPKYTRTAEEAAAVDAFGAKWNKAAPTVKVKTENGQIVSILPDHPDDDVGLCRMVDAMGISERGFIDPFLAQIANAGSAGKGVDEDGVNFMLAVVRGIQPRDQTEAMLAAQMAAVHMATMTFARRLSHVQNIQQQDAAERAFNKLTRTFATQMEALKRYRSTGDQKMTVEHQHVTVNQGGQAIVGNIGTGGGGGRKNPAGQSHAPQIAYGPGETLPCEVEAVREAVLRSSG